MFIGRRITRAFGRDELTLSVDGSHLDSTFIEYGITKGTSCVPDISVHLEKTLVRPRSRSVMNGKLLWLAQCRHDT